MVTWASIAHHELTVRPATNRRRLCRFCTTRRAATHVVCANGLAMMMGCEWHAHRWRREMLARRRSA